VFPEQLTDRLQVVRTLRERGRNGGTYLCTRAGGLSVVVKVVPSSRALSGRVSARLLAAASNCQNFALPYESGQSGEWHFQVGRYYEAGSLDAYISERGPLGNADLAELVRQVGAALAAIHVQRDGTQLVHGDIKPSNILVGTANGRALEFFLADFDCSQIVAVHGNAVPTELTTRYSAPEVLGGAGLVAASDFWSLGMSALAAHTGRRPFEGLDGPAIRRLVATDWRPAFESLGDQHVRSLLGGLLERNPGTRWTASEIGRWSRQEPAAISDGLRRAGEIATDEPFMIAGQRVHSGQALAQALLRDWHPLSGDQSHLIGWLRRTLNRADVALHFEQILADSSLSEDMKLLECCHALWPAMPFAWRGRLITPDNLDAAAAEALDGNSSSGRWLASIHESDCLRFFASRGFASAAEIRERMSAAMTEHETAWRQIVDRGGPEGAVQTPAQALPHLVRLLFSEQVRTALRETASRLFDVSSIFIRAPWFLTFGSDAGSLTDVQRHVLVQLDRVSLLTEENVQALDQDGVINEARLQNGVVVSALQRRLLRNLVVQPGTEVRTLEPGCTHRLDEHRPGLAALLLSSLARIGAALGAAIGRAARGTESSESPLPRLHAVTRFIPVTVSQRDQALPAECEMYLACISWQAPDDRVVRIVLRHALALTGHTRLRLRSLPSSGHIVLLVSADTSIFVSAIRRGREPALRLRPMTFRFRARPPLFTPRRDIVSASTRLIPARSAILALSAAKTPHEQLMPLDAHLVGATMLNRTRPVTVSAIAPTASARILWAALTRAPARPR
jgi:serine/threonine protein kinase/phage terminase large subunit-like protein